MTYPVINVSADYQALTQEVHALKLLIADGVGDLLSQSLDLEAGKKKGGLPSSYFNMLELGTVKTQVIGERVEALTARILAYQQQLEPSVPKTVPVANHSVRALGVSLKGDDLLYC